MRWQLLHLKTVNEMEERSEKQTMPDGKNKRGILEEEGSLKKVTKVLWDVTDLVVGKWKQYQCEIHESKFIQKLKLYIKTVLPQSRRINGV